MNIIRNIILSIIVLVLGDVSFAFAQDDFQFHKNNFFEANQISAKDSILKNHLFKIVKNMDKEGAISSWEELIFHCQEKKYHKGTGFCYYNLGLRLNVEGEYFKSYLAFQDSRNAFSIVKDTYGLACVYNGMGNLFNTLYKYEQALSSYFQSATLFREIDNPVFGTIYLNIGGIFVKLDSLREAKTYLDASKLILTEQKDTSGLINCFINLSEVFLSEKNTDSAFYFLLKSNELIKGKAAVQDKFNATLNLGMLYLDEDMTDHAEPLLTEAYQLAEQEHYAIPIESRVKAIKAFSELHDRKGDLATAHNLITQYLEYETESKRVRSNLDLSRLEFESLERERLLERRKRTYTLYTSLILLVSSLLIIFTFYRSSRHKQRANQLLTEMDTLKSQLYSNITHELRTPLTLILGPLEQMLSNHQEQAANRKQVKLMRKNAKSVLNLVNEMLDLAKIDAKSMKLEIQEGDIARFIRTRFASFASLAEQKHIDFKYSVSVKNHTALFDAAKLEKIINNLVSNAVKFTPKAGYIQCTCNIHSENIHTAEIIVKNSGKGIPPDQLQKIFHRFHQVESTESYTSPGTGIGLALTHELVVLMHGTIDVKSDPGRDTTFRTTIPLGTDLFKHDEYTVIKTAVPAQVSKIFSEDEPIEPEDHTGIRNKLNRGLPQILVAEDQPEIREFIQENLSDEYSVETAENGVAAYGFAIETIPDLVVTDLVMPEMGGTELCEKLKTDERTSHIPVIILTGKTGLKDKLRGLETGADAYLTKPFNVAELKIRIKKLIEQRQKLRERFTRNLNLEPKDIAVTSADERFLTHALEVIEENMGNSDFEVTQFQENLMMSRTQLFRKIKALTNQTPGEFIRTIRLKRAASLIEQNFGNVAQVSYEVGFNNPSYFAKCFKELYGKLPSEYQKIS
jgi:signal transduction histidine kinase/DNA-binding response OmpR family regulator